MYKRPISDLWAKYLFILFDVLRNQLNHWLMLYLYNIVCALDYASMLNFLDCFHNICVKNIKL